MNGYFQLETSESGTSLRMFPPFDGGQKIQVNELRAYLDLVGVPYDTTAVNSALYQLNEEPIVLFLSPTRIPAVDEKCDLQVNSDKMSAIMRLYPASAGGAELTKAHVLEQLAHLRVKAGIDEQAIENALAEKNYCTDIVVAKGKLPTAGRDAVIQYYFETDSQARPELREDGSVDFFKLNNVHHCAKGQVLAEITPEERGENGVDVYGTVTLAREVKKAKFDHGKNLQVSEDGLKLISMVDGHVSYVNGAVFVSDVYSVGDVGPATGNIEYNGNVEVKGTVCENFSIKTNGNVFVDGVVEGALIEAGGNIVITRGMHGQNKGRLEAGGNIVAKFLSGADVKAKGYVEAEQILNSRVIAGTEVHAEAGKGLITGGRVQANKAVNVKNAGSPMGAATIIEVGCDPELKKRQTQLQKNIADAAKAIPQMQKALQATVIKLKSGAKLLPEQIKNMKLLQEQYTQAQEQLKSDMKELEALDASLQFDEGAHIDVRGTMYQGVAITISGVTMNVKKEYTFCRLIKKGADIGSTNL